MLAARALVGFLCLATGIGGGAAVASASTHKPLRRAHRRTTHLKAAAAPHRSPASPGKPAVVPAVCGNANLTPTPANVALVARAAICLINQARLTAGLVPLAESPALDRAAAGHNADMSAADYFDHVSPTGETMEARVLASGYVPSGAGCALGENIAMAAAGVDDAARVVADWLGDPVHRANILDPDYRDTGLAASSAVPASLLGGRPGLTFTEELGVIVRTS
jgi:uncharacterized protein YkwD